MNTNTMQNWWMNAWRPTAREDRYPITRIRGSVPRELNGTLYRNSPSQRVLPEKGYQSLHAFDGDALIQAIRFEDGKASFTGAFVRHPTFLVEEKEGRYCMPGVNLWAEGSPVEVPPPGRIQPNTNVVYHAGRLFALVENGIPFELDPHSLESIGSFDLDGRLLNFSTSAHPKIDARTGQMILHGYSPFEPYLTLYVIEPDGRVSLAEAIDAPYNALVHDAAITENHVVVPLGPVGIDFSVLMNGGVFADAITHNPERPIRLAVRGRGPGAPVRWFEAPTPGFFIHFGNAWEEGRKLVFEAYLYRDSQAMFHALSTLRRGELGEGLLAQRYLYELDLDTGNCRDRRLEDIPSEFPRFDDRLTGYRNRWTYGVANPKVEEGSYLDALVKYDGFGEGSEYHDFGRGRIAGEPVFVPRDVDAGEDDGFVLATVYHGPDDAMDLVILDTRDFSAAPLAELRLDHRVPLGFHGNFVQGVV